VTVVPIGSSSTLLTQAKAHIMTGLGHPLFVLWDGDVRESEYQKELAEVKCLANDRGVRFSSGYLPGDAAPEGWLVDRLDCKEGYEALSSELRCTDSTFCPQLVSRLQCCGPHEVAHGLQEETGRSESDSLRVLARAAARMPSNPLRQLGDAISRSMDGEELDQFRPRAET
jgi:hypothetical protein